MIASEVDLEAMHARSTVPFSLATPSSSDFMVWLIE